MRGWLAMATALLAATALATSAQRLMMAGDPAPAYYGSLAPAGPEERVLRPAILDDEPTGNSTPEIEDAVVVQPGIEEELRLRAATELKANGYGHFITEA